MNAQDLISNLNIVAEKLFKSVEKQVFEMLDNIIVIGPEILKQNPLKSIFYENKINGIIIIANSLILFYIVYYVFSQLISIYNGNKANSVYIFIIRTIIVIILANCSYYICEQVLSLFSTFTYGIESFGSDLTGKAITFRNLKETIVSLESIINSDLLSLDGIIKGMVAFGSVSILINFSIRYVTIIFLLVISPLAIISLSNEITSGIFNTWGKTLIINLSMQVVIKLIIIIPLVYKDTEQMLYKVVLVGTICLIYKLNSFTREILNKITSQMQVKNIFRE